MFSSLSFMGNPLLFQNIHDFGEILFGRFEIRQHAVAMHHARPGEHCIRHARAPARGLKLRLCAIERLVCTVKEVDIAHAGIVAARNADANKLIVLPPPLSNQKEQPREHDRTRQIARADNAKRRHGQKQRQGFVSTPRRFRRSPKIGNSC